MITYSVWPEDDPQISVVVIYEVNNFFLQYRHPGGVKNPEFDDDFESDKMIEKMGRTFF